MKTIPLSLKIIIHQVTLDKIKTALAKDANHHSPSEIQIRFCNTFA